MSIPSGEDKGESVLGHVKLVLILTSFSGYIVPEQIPDPRLGVVLQGAFLGEHFHNLTDNYVFVYIQLVHMPQSFAQNTTKDMANLYYAAEVSSLALIDKGKSQNLLLSEHNGALANSSGWRIRYRFRAGTQKETHLPTG